ADHLCVMACGPVMGYGGRKKQGTAATHGSPLGEDEIRGARDRLGWHHAPFEVPKPVLASWRAVGARNAVAFERWQAAANRLEASARAHLTDPIDQDVRGKIGITVKTIKSDFSREAAKLATRQSSQKVLERLLPVVPGLIGGSARLTAADGPLTQPPP